MIDTTNDLHVYTLGPTTSTAFVEPAVRRHRHDWLWKSEQTDTVTTISELPNDVLLHIFPFCATESCQLPMKTDDPRLILSQICSRWRHLVVAYSPAIWADLELLPSRSTPKSTTRESKEGYGREMVRWWITRTGDRPLSLKAGYFSFECLAVSPMDDIVFPFSTRFRKLELLAPQLMAKKLLASKPGSFPLLEHLELGSPNCTSKLKLPAAAEGATIFPALRWISLTFLVPTMGLSKVGFPWNQIRYLCLHNSRGSFETGVELLQLCKNTLEELVLSPGLDVKAGMDHLPLIHLPILRSIRVCFATDRQTQVLPLFLRLLKAPKLERLCVRGDFNTRWSQEAFQELVHRSSCAVEILDLCQLTFDEEINATIRSTVSLRQLTLGLGHAPESLLSIFTSGITDAAWAPQLEYLGISLIADSSTSLAPALDTILEGIRRRLGIFARETLASSGLVGGVLRSHPPATLRKVEIHILRDYENRALENHSRLVKGIEEMGCSVTLGRIGIM